MRTWRVGDIDITRVPDPRFELVLPQDDATTQTIAGWDWLRPHFVTDESALRVGSSTILVRSERLTALVDPWLAFDDPTRFEGRLAALAHAGCQPEDVDVVVNTHIDGIGANVAPATGDAAFPNARYFVPGAEIDAAREGRREGAEALLGLVDAGRVELVDGDHDISEELRLEETPGHNDCHVVAWITSGGSKAVVAGHLFLHPAQIGTPDNVLPGEDRVVLPGTRRSLLQRCADEDALLIGPLFADPGGGRVKPGQGGAEWQFEAAG